MMKPMTFLSSSLTSARTPRHPSNSLKPHSVHCEASGDSLKICVTAAASPGRTALSVVLTCSHFVAATMRLVRLTEDLRVRPPHVIRIQRQRIGELARRRCRQSHPPDHRFAHTFNSP